MMESNQEKPLSPQWEKEEIVQFCEDHTEAEIQKWLNQFFCEIQSIKKLMLFIKENYQSLGKLASWIDYNGDIFASHKTSGSRMVYLALVEAHPYEIPAIVQCLVSVEFQMMVDNELEMSGFLREDSVAKAGFTQQMSVCYTKGDLGLYLKNIVRFLSSIEKRIPEQMLESLLGAELEIYNAMVGDKTVGSENVGKVIFFTGVDTAMAGKIRNESKNDDAIIKKTAQQRDNTNKLKNKSSKEYQALLLAIRKINKLVEEHVDRVLHPEKETKEEDVKPKRRSLLLSEGLVKLGFRKSGYTEVNPEGGNSNIDKVGDLKANQQAVNKVKQQAVLQKLNKWCERLNSNENINIEDSITTYLQVTINYFENCLSDVSFVKSGIALCEKILPLAVEKELITEKKCAIFVGQIKMLKTVVDWSVFDKEVNVDVEEEKASQRKDNLFRK